MDWKTFLICCGGMVLLSLLGTMIYDAGKAAAYKELSETYRQNCRDLITKLAQAGKSQ